jgi:hypothetical protein
MSNLVSETSTTTQKVNNLTGEITEDIKVKVKEYKNQIKIGHFYSIFQDAYVLLGELTGQQRKVFDILCCIIKFDKNRVDLNSTIRVEVSNKVGISVSSFNNQLCRLKKLGVLKSIGKDSFMVNPAIVFMGTRAKAVVLRNEFLKLK